MRQHRKQAFHTRGITKAQVFLEQLAGAMTHKLEPLARSNLSYNLLCLKYGDQLC
jgi:hypothetical protein